MAVDVHPARERAASGHRALLRLLRPQLRGVLAGVSVTLLGGVAGLAQPLAAKRVLDSLGDDRPVGGALLGLSVLVVAGAVLGALGYCLLQRTAEALACAVRRRLADRLLRLRVPVLESAEPGDLIARVTSDTTLLRQVATQPVAALASSAVIGLATVVMMGLLDPVLLAVTLAVVAVIGVVVAVVAPRISRAARNAQEAVGGLGSALERALGGFRTVKASGAEPREAAVLHEAAERARHAGVRAAAWQAVSLGSTQVAVQAAFLAVLGVGGARVASGAIGVSTLVAFLLYLFALAPLIGQLAEAVGLLQVGAAAAARLCEAEELETEELEVQAPAPAPALVPSAPRALPGPRPAPAPAPALAVAVECRPASVAFDRVCFAYQPGLPRVHHEVSFTVPARGMTAFVGPSGAGKTTVFSLIERFHDRDSGLVLVDGRDVRHWPLGELRATIGYVEQDAPVLAGTLRENLLIGAPRADEDELREVLRRARLLALVERLPQGLDTQVGHRGTRLSGGERQRVAIARALLRRPRLLLLDEATSQLDAANEAALRDTVAEAAGSTTVLVAAHRLSTVTCADRIVVMERGRVRAVGTHQELVRGDALYRELAATQFLAGAHGATAP
ncbi:ABC transporter ATP-binding protein [Streptomyces capparidis]